MKINKETAKNFLFFLFCSYVTVRISFFFLFFGVEVGMAVLRAGNPWTFIAGGIVVSLLVAYGQGMLVGSFLKMHPVTGGFLGSAILNVLVLLLDKAFQLPHPYHYLVIIFVVGNIVAASFGYRYEVTSEKTPSGEDKLGNLLLKAVLQLGAPGFPIMLLISIAIIATLKFVAGVPV